jgi:hypothetical protein
MCVAMGHFRVFQQNRSRQTRAVMNNVIASSEQQIFDHSFFAVPGCPVAIPREVSGHDPSGGTLSGRVSARRHNSQPFAPKEPVRFFLYVLARANEHLHNFTRLLSQRIIGILD